MNKKSLILVIALLVVSFAVSGIVSAVRGNVVEYYLADITVDEFGHIEVKETLVINYRSYHNYILRDVRYQKSNYSGEPYNQYPYSTYQNDVASFAESSVGVKVYRGNIVDDPNEATDVTSTMDIGYSFNGDYYQSESGNYPIECPPGLSNCETIGVGAINSGTLVDLMSFEFTYTIYGMVTSYNDISELNYKVFEYMGMKVKKAVVEVYLPNNSNSVDDIYAYGHGLGNGKITKLENNRIVYDAKNIKTNEEFEIRVLFPNNVTSKIRTINKVNADLFTLITDYENELMALTLLQYRIAFILNIVTVLIILLMGFVIYKVYIKYNKEFTPKFDHEYLRDLPFDYPPAVMSYLFYFAKTNDEDVTATLLDLIRRGYCELIAEGEISSKNPDFTINLIKDKSTDALYPHEKHLINWFFNIIGNGSSVTIEQIEKFGKSYDQAVKFKNQATTFVNKVKERAKEHDFFINTTKAKSKAYSYVLIPFIMLFALLFAYGAYNISFTWNFIALGIVILGYLGYVASIKKRSLNGVEEFAMWKAFKKFLEDFSSFEDYPMPTIIIWEQYLAYATSLKIADKVMAQLKVKLPQVTEVEGTYMSSRYYGGTGFYFGTTINRVNKSISSARLNSFNSIAAHNASKMGGGFSGGSSGGGGGGGFRGGR